MASAEDLSAYVRKMMAEERGRNAVGEGVGRERLALRAMALRGRESE